MTRDLPDLEQEDLVPFLTHLPFFPMTHCFLMLSGERLTRLLDLEHEDLVPFLTHLPFFLMHCFLTLSGERLTRLLDLELEAFLPLTYLIDLDFLALKIYFF